MAKRYADLIAAIDRDRSTAAARQSPSHYRFVQEGSAKALEGFDILYRILRSLCDEAENTKGLARWDNVMHSQIFKALQDLSGLLPEVISPQIDPDLYFFLEEVRSDFGIEKMLSLRAETAYVTKRFQDYVPAFEIPSKLNLENRASLLEKLDDLNLAVIELPRTEADNALAWTLLVHECLHVAVLVDKVLRDFPAGFKNAVAARKRQEVVIDLLAAEYMGPVYCLMIARMPEKIGRHEGLEHPSAAARNRYLGAAIKWCDDHVTADTKRNQATTRIINDVTRRVLKELTGMLGAEPLSAEDAAIVDFVESNINSIQAAIAEAFIANKTPIWYEEIERSISASSLKGKSSQELSEKLDRLVRKGGVLPTIRPSALYNIVLLMSESEEGGALKDPMLTAFRKWAVRKAYKAPTLTT